MKQTRFLFFIIFIALATSCRITKYVPQGETLLSKVYIKSDNKNIKPEELKPFILQTQNQEVFSFMKIKLAMYSGSGSDTTKRMNRWLRKIGEEPVIYDPYSTEKSKRELLRQLANKGYIRAEVQTSTTEKKRKTKVTYLIKTNEPYIINRYKLKLNNDSAQYFIRTSPDSSRIIKEGDIFDVDKMEAERLRISKILRNNGYYGFQKDMLYFTADTSAKMRTVNIELKTRPYFEKNDSSVLPFVRRKIRNVTILVETDPALSTADSAKKATDTIWHENYRIIYKGKHYLKPRSLTSNVFILPNSYYQESLMEQTHSSLNFLPPVKYVNINFKEISKDKLDCYIIVNPDKNHVFSVELEGTNSEGNLGVAGNINYAHKNIFHGGETFKVGFRGAYETMGHIGDSFYSSTELGGNISLNFPTFLFPMKSSFRKTLQASTEVAIGYNYQKRPQYSRNIANAGIKYNWVKNNNPFVRYTFDLLDISYIYLPWIMDEFKQKYLSPSSSLRYSYEDHFIMRIGFGVNYSTKRENKLQDYITIRSRVKTAGNVLYGISNLVKQEKQDSVYKIFNIRYAQFVKGDIDFSFNKVLDERNRFAFRAALGVAYPYGNANILPFEERYFSGGANSVRGWSVRTLGPGTFKNTSGAIDFMRQSGDIKLDLSCEYRMKLFWLLEGALFVDAGNIWTIKEYNDQPGGSFVKTSPEGRKYTDFYKEIALGYGIGIRVDFSFFLIRLDFGLKLYDPTLDTGQRWRTNLTKNDYAWHFAIGYPF